MANIGTTTAFYKVETSLTRANNEVSKSMERLATGRQNANAGDRSSYVAMADTFRLDFVGTKAGIKGASVVMGYLETGMRVLDAASMLLSRLQELAILGANDTNTTADAAAIDAEAEAIGDEFNRLMSNSTYKGKNVFVTTAGSEYVSLGGRDAEMTFGIGTISYTELHDGNNNSTTDLAHTPSSAVAAATSFGTTGTDFGTNTTWEITETIDGTGDAQHIVDNSDLTATSQVVVGATFKVDGSGIANLSKNYAFKSSTNRLTEDIEAVQAKVNTARVQAGSQYAALESAVSFTTDLTAQYELGFNTVNDVNFSMETAHLAKNQILQQAATAMLAQANQGQQGLLQLIQS
jgi:flagellin